MKQAIAVTVRGIKCDAPGCDYCDKNAVAEDYVAYLDKPCPKCGASLLTKEDLAAVQMIQAIASYVNSTAGPVPDDLEQVELRMRFNGTGVPEIIGAAQETE